MMMSRSSSWQILDSRALARPHQYVLIEHFYCSDPPGVGGLEAGLVRGSQQKRTLGRVVGDAN